MDIKSINLKDLRIRTYPDPVLRQAAAPIERVGPEHAALAERMLDIMIESRGVGLAATQLAIPVRLIVVSLTGNREDAEVLVNPQLSDLEGSFEFEEGCLSVPNVRAKVRRSGVCTATALDLTGSQFVMDAVEFSATVLQHETDHLDGKLFVDRIGTVARMGCRRALKQMERDYSGGDR